MNECPLGSGALSGNPFGVDREALAADLGFARPTGNSLDAVADRDFVIELIGWGALLMAHLSRFAEDLIVYGTQEFGFVKLADACAARNSSARALLPRAIMLRAHFADARSSSSPGTRRAVADAAEEEPRRAELIRGKAGRVLGHQVALLTSLKGLPTAYNKDLQEDKAALFDALDTVEASLQIASGVLATITPVPERMKASLNSFMLATDLSEYLVRRGVLFRETHHVSGRAVQLAEERGCALTDLTLADLQGLHPLFADDVMGVWDFEAAVERRDATGGTSKRSVLQQAATLEREQREVSGASGGRERTGHARE